MIVEIEGKITHKEPTFLHIKLNSGLSYGVHVSLQTGAKVELDQNISLKITQIIREDAHLMYGFLQKNEQSMFNALLKVNGIGATTALAVCSTLTPKGFNDALMQGSVESFKQVPGIGPKTAKRVLVELSELSLVHDEDINPTYHDAFLALEGLGFKKDKITQALKNCVETSTPELIKEALKKMTK